MRSLGQESAREGILSKMYSSSKNKLCNSPVKAVIARRGCAWYPRRIVGESIVDFKGFICHATLGGATNGGWPYPNGGVVQR